MSRAVVYSMLTTDVRMTDLGFHADPQANVIVNYDGEQRPPITITSDNPMFLVIRWLNEDFDPMMKRGPRHFDIWLHMAREFSTDYTRIDDVIEVLDDVLTNILDTPGADGRSVTTIEQEGRSMDLQDDIYQTVCRQASYKMISRMTATGKV